MYAQLERGDFAASAAFLHADVEATCPDGPEPGSVVGVAALPEFWRGFLPSWDDFRVTAEEFRELDDSRFLVLFSRSGRGRSSEMEISQLSGANGADVLEIRDGKVVRLVSYWERDRALVDLGLTTDTGTSGL